MADEDAIPVIVSDETELPEGLASYYQQDDDGSYVLKASGVDSHPEVQNLRSSLQRQKQDREKLRKERDQLKDKASLVPDDVDRETLQETIERLRNGEGDNAGTGQDQQGQNNNGGDQRQQGQDPARIRQQVEQRYQKEVEERDQKLQEKDQQLRQMVLDRDLDAALQKHGITKPGRLKGAKKLLQEQVTIQEGDDGTPQPVVESDMGDMSLTDFVQRWVNSDEGADYLDANTGSGAPGGSGAGRGKAKQLRRSQFEAMSPEDQMKFVKNGGEVVAG